MCWALFFLAIAVHTHNKNSLQNYITLCTDTWSTSINKQEKYVRYFGIEGISHVYEFKNKTTIYGENEIFGHKPFNNCAALVSNKYYARISHYCKTKEDTEVHRFCYCKLIQFVFF